jgi:hypothetical protein
MQKYLLDTNIFIQAHRVSYPFDIFPSFWEKIIELAERGNIISIDKVKMEICDKSSHQDELSVWCTTNLKDDFFVDTSIYIDRYTDIINWAVSSSLHYTQNAIDEFLQTDLADPWLIAYAKENDVVIVTYEKSNPQAKGRIKIPEPCKHFNIKYISIIEMFRELKVKL